MNRHYTQITEFTLPWHEGQEHATTVYVFDVDEEKADELYDLGYAHGRDWDHIGVERAIMEDLNVSDDYGVMPGAPFHRYSARFSYPFTVYLEDELAYNV